MKTGMINKIQAYFERQAFGVCNWWGHKLGIDTLRVRKSFIYLSFITVGSPLVLYLIMAFILENKRYFKPGSRKRSIWDI
ncbi:MAG TPA: PspC domain-containing protein [Flavobacteriales bacterium]|nr:PspC domain-containing protein [Flavobacteriales bacterium]